MYGAWTCSCVCAGAPIQAGVEANGLTLECFLQSLLHLTSRKIYFAVIVCKGLHAHEYRCHQRSKTVPPGLGVTHSWQLPSVGDGPQTQVLSHSTSESSLQPSHLTYESTSLTDTVHRNWLDWLVSEPQAPAVSTSSPGVTGRITTLGLLHRLRTEIYTVHRHLPPEPPPQPHICLWVLIFFPFFFLCACLVCCIKNLIQSLAHTR